MLVSDLTATQQCNIHSCQEYIPLKPKFWISLSWQFQGSPKLYRVLDRYAYCVTHSPCFACFGLGS